MDAIQANIISRNSITTTLVSELLAHVKKSSEQGKKKCAFIIHPDRVEITDIQVIPALVRKGFFCRITDTEKGKMLTIKW